MSIEQPEDVLLSSSSPPSSGQPAETPPPAGAHPVGDGLQGRGAEGSVRLAGCHGACALRLLLPRRLCLLQGPPGTTAHRAGARHHQSALKFAGHIEWPRKHRAMADRPIELGKADCAVCAGPKALWLKNENEKTSAQLHAITSV